MWGWGGANGFDVDISSTLIFTPYTPSIQTGENTVNILIIDCDRARSESLVASVTLVWRSQTPTARAGGSGVLSIRDFVPLEFNALRNTYRNPEARH